MSAPPPSSPAGPPTPTTPIACRACGCWEAPARRRCSSRSRTTARHRRRRAHTEGHSASRRGPLVGTPRMTGPIRGWTTQLGAATLRHQRPPRRTGIVAAVLSVAIATLAIYFLRRIAPVVSLSVVYLPAVLLVATFWGMTLGLLTSLLSAAAFNFFHIPPTGKFTIVDGRNWVALAAFMIVAVVASTIAEVARSRADEAERRRA